MAKKIEFSNHNIQKIIGMYESLSVAKIAEEFEVNRQVISRVLKENNISIRDNNQYKYRYSFNEEFFKRIDTEEKAYWLGFIYADGYIIKDGKLGIKISITDYDHLDKFKKSIESNHPIHVYDCQGGFSNTSNQFCMIEVNSKDNIVNLRMKGVTNRKSKILEFPTNDIVPSKLIRHFIRGYFDGDGSVYKQTYGGSVSFIGTYSFLEGIKSSLNFDTSADIYQCRDKDIYEFKVGGTNQIVNMFNYLYDNCNANVFLDRKYEKFVRILEG